jgi:hypothetical protein
MVNMQVPKRVTICISEKTLNELCFIRQQFFEFDEDLRTDADVRTSKTTAMSKYTLDDTIGMCLDVAKERCNMLSSDKRGYELPCERTGTYQTGGLKHD